MHIYILLGINPSHRIDAVCNLYFPCNIFPESLSILEKHYFNNLQYSFTVIKSTVMIILTHKCS